MGLDAAVAAVQAELDYAHLQLGNAYRRVEELRDTLRTLERLDRAGMESVNPAIAHGRVDADAIALEFSGVELVHSTPATPEGSGPVVPPQGSSPPAPQHIPTSSPPQEPLRVVEPVELDEDDDPGVSHYVCHCGREFPTRHGLVMHKTRTHKFDPDAARIRAAEAFS